MNRRILFFLGIFVALGSVSALYAEDRKRPPVALGARRPLIAVWRFSEGYPVPGAPLSQAPYLRIAIWEDGRVLFAANPKNWEHKLQQGIISAKQVAELKKRIVATGAFDLKGTCYLVPDAPWDCIMADVGGKRQMLYWDEWDSPNYGINSNPKPQHIKFKNCWKALNQIALANRPKNARPVKGRFSEAPESWYVKQPIQSK